MKGVKHYTKDGKEWKGATHKMPNGKLMTQNPHNKDSEELFHKEDLDEASLDDKLRGALGDKDFEKVISKEVPSVASLSAMNDKRVNAVAKAIMDKYDIPDDGRLKGVIRVALSDYLEEMSTTGGGNASFTPGTGMTYATPYAFKRPKKKQKAIPENKSLKTTEEYAGKKSTKSTKDYLNQQLVYLNYLKIFWIYFLILFLQILEIPLKIYGKFRLLHHKDYMIIRK